MDFDDILRVDRCRDMDRDQWRLTPPPGEVGEHDPPICPSPPFPSPPLPCPPSLPLPLEVGPLKYSKGVWGSAVSSPSGVWGGAPAEIDFGAF